jgi:mRNA-degrading endonuclease RelE of RelBE toxin-antitoxin system
MIFIQWTNAAFRNLKVLPEEIAFEIIRQVDFLADYPEMGAPMETRFARLKGLRQLIVKRSWRVVYDFEAEKETVFVVAVQNCRQKLPSMRELKRRKRPID